jgi:hypothetical protein
MPNPFFRRGHTGRAHERVVRTGTCFWFQECGRFGYSTPDEPGEAKHGDVSRRPIGRVVDGTRPAKPRRSDLSFFLG